MRTGHKNEEQIFTAAIEIESCVERNAYIAKACGDDQKLLAAVQALLQQHDTNSFLDAPIFEPDLILDESPISEGPGTVIGRYKLLEKIGEGGMAVVYMAEQEKPIRRKVALKIIKLGMDTKSVIARFEAERQALAMMDHPNIARVLDAGATETGRPYFVMDLVPGLSITEYCDKNRLSIKERLKLFISVCNAVQHAHQKGIIHRDVKPSNVMVTQHDGRPVPKVIDFGIAKAINQKLTEKTLFTRYAHIIGTPAYMSPEQAELSDLDVDTRTDIYSLGVLLYELLTGTTPFSEEELREAGYLQMQKIICEEEPTKPSTKLSTLGKALTDVAKRHSSSPELMPKLIRGDLDWIVMKSLEKDRSRRYETANMLALDIRRHLEHEPVMARGPGTTYRVQKFLRRHRSQTIATLAMMVVAGAVVVILSMWNKDRHQLAEAEGFRHRGILSQAREQYAKAEREAALETLKPILSSRHVGPEARLLNAGILVDNRRSDEAMTILGNLLDERPEIAGAAHSLLARILWESESPSAEKLKEIEEHRRQAEALLPETAEAYFLRAMTAVTVKEQFASLDRALQLDPAHYESRRLRSFTYFASRKYDRLRDDALVMTILRPRDPLGYSLHAIALRELGKYTDAIAEYDSAIALTSRGDPQYIDLSTQRCETLLRMGDYERVITDAEACLKLSPDKPASVAGRVEGVPPSNRGQDARDTMGALDTKDFSPLQYHIFCALTALGDFDKATSLFRQIISPGHEARKQFQDWCAKYVFDTLEVGRSWHPQDREPIGAAFMPLVEAEETYLELSAKGRRLTTDGFTARWSPDGKKLAFSAGVHGYSGVAVFDPATKETELLIVPGKDPLWSPDGKYIAFVRDCQLLRVSEFIAAERKEQHRLLADEEVWVMKADGTEPRRLARGGWPSWSQDSTCIYYNSRVDKALYSISIKEQNAEPKRIMACSNAYPSVSPDNQRVAYLENASMKVKDLTSQTLLAEQSLPFSTWGGAGWSPTGHELCLGGRNDSDDRTGLWIYNLDKNEFKRTLDGQIVSASWSPQATNLAICLGPPYFEIWAADLDPNVSTIEVLGPGKTIDEHFQEMLTFYDRRIEVDPQDAYAYSGRAHYYDCLHEREKARADMRSWSAILSGGSFSDSHLTKARNNRRILTVPFGYQLVFSVEERENDMQVPCIALGQKGRCNMKSFQIPMLSMSLIGLCLLSGLDTPPAHAGFTFGEVTRLPVPADIGNGVVECLSCDGLEMYIVAYNRSGGYGGWDLWVSKRVKTDSAWGPMENLGPAINTPNADDCPSISVDGLTLYFNSYNHPGGYGNHDIYMATRATKNDPWGNVVLLPPPVNSAAADALPWISPDGLELYFTSARPGGYGVRDIWVAKRTTEDDPWGDPVNLGPGVSSPYYEVFPSLSPDGLLLLFCDSPWGDPVRPGGYGDTDLWMARRASLSEPWQAAVNLGPLVNSSGYEGVPRITPDGRTLYFDREYDTGQVPIILFVDFNGDGQVDGKDLLCMASRWGTDDPLCDIGPFAWGDGTVDLQDLIVLAEYIGKEVIDPALIAHWTLDESEGTVAVDSAGGKDGYVLGDAAWQPAGGQVDGALQLDGVDDYVITSFVLDPSEGPFSVLAWVKGGAPGQVVVSHSQGMGANCLMVDDKGRLMTELGSSTGANSALLSQTIITDGKWHRIGLVWDGSYRYLYVDGAEVARDAAPLPGLESGEGGLFIGAGNGVETGSLWSGLIDDVRIYNRVVNP